VEHGRLTVSKAMFDTRIVKSDAFLSMPKSARLLYFALGMEADYDGFVGNPLTVMRLNGCSKKDFDILISKRFIILFENNVCVMKHHLMNNNRRVDRKHPTQYQDELKTLRVKDNNAYTEVKK
jgi:hypothetical protein